MNGVELFTLVYSSIAAFVWAWYYFSTDGVYHSGEKTAKAVHGLLAAVCWLPLLIVMAFDSNAS